MRTPEAIIANYVDRIATLRIKQLASPEKDFGAIRLEIKQTKKALEEELRHLIRP